MRPFRYLRDRLFLSCCSLYVLNRWGLKPHLQGAFFQCWFNDALLMPCAVPVLLRIHAWLGLRERHALPGAWEIIAHLAGWSVLFEIIGPLVSSHATRDGWDVVAYSVGAAAAYLWWHREQFWQPALPAHEL